MQIEEKQAIDYLTGVALVIKKKIEIFDLNYSEDNDLYVTQDERLMAESLEIVLQKAKVNILMINKDAKNAD